MTGADGGVDVGADVGADAVDVAILRELSRGRTIRETAVAVSVSERTIRRRVNLFAQRVGVSTTIEAVVYAVRAAII